MTEVANTNLRKNIKKKEKDGDGFLNKTKRSTINTRACLQMIEWAGVYGALEFC